MRKAVYDVHSAVWVINNKKYDAKHHFGDENDEIYRVYIDVKDNKIDDFLALKTTEEEIVVKSANSKIITALVTDVVLPQGNMPLTLIELKLANSQQKKIKR